MAASHLSYSLSEEQTALFNEMARSALLPQTAVPGKGELVERYKKEQRESQRKQMQPYADLLGCCILRQIHAKRDELLAELHAQPWDKMSVPLFSWNTVMFNETIQEMNNRTDGMKTCEYVEESRKIAERARMIEECDGEHMFGVAQTERFGVDVALREVRIERIFRNSDLATQLVTALGPNFTYKIEYTRVTQSEHYDYESPYGFRVMTKTLLAVYHPFGMTKTMLMKNLEVYKAYTDREVCGEIKQLAGDQWLRGSGNWKEGQPEYMLTPKVKVAHWAEEEEVYGLRVQKPCSSCGPFCPC